MIHRKWYHHYLNRESTIKRKNYITLYTQEKEKQPTGNIAYLEQKINELENYHNATNSTLQIQNDHRNYRLQLNEHLNKKT